MILLAVDDRDPRALLVIAAVVSNPSLPQHLMPKAQFVVLALVVERIFRERIGALHLERMRRGTQPDHRPATIEIVIEMLHLLLRKILKPQKDHRQIRRVQRLHARHVRVAGDDLAGLLVDIE